MILGMDEVGRGAWAGPVVVGAVVLSGELDGLRDSKLLTAKRRMQFAALIYAQAAAWSIGSASPQEIDELGLTAALRLAYERALAEIGHAYTEIVIDGSYNFLPGQRAQTITRADQTVPAVSAASIIAKVWRDRYMAQVSTTYSGYGFERHVGYGTAAHQAALRIRGVCALHRRSFRPIADQVGAV